MDNLAERTLKDLMPNGPTWEGKENGVMSEQLKGLAVQFERDRLSGKQITLDFFPTSTTQLKEWEYVFRLPNGSSLTVDQRRKRLVASWTKKSPSAYSSINQIYALSGLDVIARPLAENEDPRLIDYDDIIFSSGSPGAFVKNYVAACGIMHCGDISESSFCGAFTGGREIPIEVTIPDDNKYWPLIYVLEAPSGGKAQVPGELKAAFESLTFKNKPLFMWALSRVEYV